MNPDEKSRIEELKKTLYSRSTPDIRTRRKLRFVDQSPSVQTEWKDTEETAPKQPVLDQDYEDHSMSFFTKLLIGSIIFCLAAVGIGVYLFLNGANLISANNISIGVSGPVSVPGGEPVSFDISVINKNNVELQLVDLSVDFPAGTTDPTNTSSELKNYQKLLGDLAPGGSVSDTVKAIIFGEENAQKEITITLTYGVKGSSSVFTKTRTYDVLINSSPITLTASAFKEITSGQPFDLKLTVKSNSEETLKNILVKASYPFGFSFASSDIQPLSDKATWRLGDLPAGGVRSITIHGALSGENNDTRVFRFSVGSQSSTNASSIGTQYMEVEQDVSIAKPFISLGIAIDGDSSGGGHVGSYGSPNRVELSWFNNLSSSVSNMVITAKLSGTAYDKNAVSANQGYFDSANNQIIWSAQTNPDFASVGAGDSGNVSFTILPKDLGTASSPVTSPVVTVTASVSADRTQESNVPGSLVSSVTRDIRVSSNISLSGRVARTTGPFVNTGPVPPKVEQATTYTVVWTVDNTSSAVGRAQVTATLPPYVKWLGNVSPSGEDVKYDTTSGTITWNIGNMSTYTLGSGRRREVDFQISLQPSVTQEGQAPTLVNPATFSATDNFTGARLESTQDYMTTRFSTDPSYRQGDETVVK